MCDLDKDRLAITWITKWSTTVEAYKYKSELVNPIYPTPGRIGHKVNFLSGV